MSDQKAGENVSTQVRAKARRFEILEFMLNKSIESGDVRFADITARFENSETKNTTLQNDLRILKDLKLIESVAQGLYKPTRFLKESIYEKTRYASRLQHHEDLKVAVARACINHKRPNGAYLLGNRYCLISQGTSTEPIFKELHKVEPIQRPDNIVTNSVPGILELLGSRHVGLSIIGGTPDLDCGAIRPVVRGEEESGEATGLEEWIGNIHVNMAILSCSSIDVEGSIYCGDHMEGFRQAIINHPNIDLIILADSTKVGSGPTGRRVATKVKWDSKNTWLFIDNRYRSEAFEGFQEKMGENFVEVDPEEFEN